MYIRLCQCQPVWQLLRPKSEHWVYVSDIPFPPHLEARSWEFSPGQAILRWGRDHCRRLPQIVLLVSGQLVLPNSVCISYRGTWSAFLSQCLGEGGFLFVFLPVSPSSCCILRTMPFSRLGTFRSLGATLPVSSGSQCTPYWVVRDCKTRR